MKKNLRIIIAIIIAIIGICIIIVTKQKENYKQSYTQSNAEKEFLEWVKQNETNNIINGEIYIDTDGIKTIESSSGTKIKCKSGFGIGFRGSIKEQWSPYYIFTGISDLFWINNNNTLSIREIGQDGYDEHPQFTKLIYAPGNKYTGMYVEFKRPEKAIMLKVKLPFKNSYNNDIPITLHGTFLIIKQTNDGISLLSDETIKVNNWRGDSGDFNPNLIGTNIVLNNSTNEIIKNNIDKSNVTDKNIVRTTLMMSDNCYSVKNAEGEFLNKNDNMNKSTMPYTMMDEKRIQVPYSKSYTFTNFNYKSDLSRIYVTIFYKEYKNIKDYTEEYQVYTTKEMNKVIINPDDNTVYVSINKSDNLSIYLPYYVAENGYLKPDGYKLKVNGSYVKIKCGEKEDFLYSDGEIIVNYTAGKKYTIIKEN